VGSTRQQHRRWFCRRRPAGLCGGQFCGCRVGGRQAEWRRRLQETWPWWPQPRRQGRWSPLLIRGGAGSFQGGQAGGGPLHQTLGYGELASSCTAPCSWLGNGREQLFPTFFSTSQMTSPVIVSLWILTLHFSSFVCGRAHRTAL
jgi:hypothetical protein